jgi:DNA-binding CsgD family transcriptional regulator
MQTQDAAPGPHTEASSATTLHGRRKELDHIDDLLRAARESHSAVLVVRGPAGIGKTALLDEARARAGGMQVLVCRGTELEKRLPFAALHQLLRPVLDRIDAIPTIQAQALRCALGLEGGSQRPERFLVSLATLNVLAEAAERAPLLCVVDDAHWLDDASADILVFVARRLDAEPIAMVLAARDEEHARARAPELPQLTLAGLDDDASHAVIEGRALAPDVAAWLVGATDGNPLALLELSAGLTDAQAAGVEPILGPLPISSALERAFLTRVRRLPPATQELLLVAATDESGDLTTILDAAAGLGIAAEALDDAERAGLIRARGMRLELRHPLVRSAIYHGAPHSQRRAAHRALAAVLVGESRADRRAWHRAAASTEPDPAVVGELEEAARRAHARGGYDAASLAFERAAALAADEHERARLLTAAAENAWLPGQRDRALALLRRVRAQSAATAVRADADRLLGVIELTCGEPADSTEILRAAARDAAADEPQRGLYLLSLASWGAALARDGDMVVQIADSAQRLEVTDTPRNRFLLTRLAGLRAHFTRDFDAAAQRFRTTLALADGAAADGLPDRLGLVSPVGLFLCDDRAVLGLHRRAAAQAREHGMVALLTQTLPWVALGDIWGGHWPSASATLAEGLEMARGTSQHQIEAHLIAIQALLAAARGDEEACRARAAESLELASARRLVHVSCCATWALLVLELGLGRPDAALTHARALPKAAGVDWDALDRIEAAVRAGDTEAARAWLDEFEPWARSSRALWGEAVALHCRALLAADAAEAERRFEAALAAHDRAGRPFERARTELAFGECLRRARRRADARTHLRGALERVEALGAALWAERARTELRATGESARKRDPSTLDQLTAQEVQIAQLVSEGRTNRDVAGQLFLSPRTIDYHLRNVFRKLEIASRNELARIDLAQVAGAGATPAAGPGAPTTAGSRA